MNYLKTFFSKQFLFEIDRIRIHVTDKAFLLVGIAFLLMAVVMTFGARMAPTPIDANYRKKISSPFWFLGISEIVWYGLRYENIPFFGSHFVAICLALIALVWLAATLKRAGRNYQAEKTEWEKSQIKLKYLPK